MEHGLSPNESAGTAHGAEHNHGKSNKFVLSQYMETMAQGTSSTPGVRAVPLWLAPYGLQLIPKPHSSQYILVWVNQRRAFRLGPSVLCLP